MEVKSSSISLFILGQDYGDGYFLFKKIKNNSFNY